MKSKFKHCGGCDKNLSLKEFYKSKHQSDGLTTQCKKCSKIRSKKWWAKNKINAKPMRQKYRKENKVKFNKYSRDFYKKTGWEYKIKKKYGITAKQYYAMLKAQKGGCWICGSVPKKRRLHIDHNHKSGKIRGLLCMRCNRGLSWFSDKSERLRRAAEYLEQNGLHSVNS